MVSFNKTLRTYKNWLIVSLAVSDIFTWGILLPTVLIKPASVVTDYIMSNFLLLSGVANICAVNYNRYVAKMKPLYYPYRAPNLFQKAIFVSWLIPVIYSLLPLIWDKDRTLTVNVVYVVCLEVLGTVVPYIFITFAQVRIFRQVRRSLRMFACKPKACWRSSYKKVTLAGWIKFSYPRERLLLINLEKGGDGRYC